MIKAGFIGFGRMGMTHFSILNIHPSVQAVAVCDQSATMLKIAKKYLNVQTYTDYEKMLDECQLDCVIISTPGDSHAEIMKVCLQRGLHIFVEKPLAMTVLDGQSVIAELGARPLVNQVGYVNRFNEVFMEIKQLLARDLIGNVVNFSSEMYGATVLKDSKSGWRSNKKAGGGCMFEFASHCIDLVVYLFDKPDSVAGSVLQSIYSSEVEDLVSSTFIYKKGLSGSISVNWSDETFRKPVNIIKIFGTHGKIIADKHSFKIYLKKSDNLNGFDPGWNTRYITDFARSVRFYVRGNEFTRQLDYFVDCIEGRVSDNVACFSEGLKTDILMEEITKDAAMQAGRAIMASGGVAALGRTPERKSFWKKLFRSKEKKYA
jgi:predicted dehydrogenase